MKKQIPHISDEYIVAYSDGEFQASPDFERELCDNSSLAKTTQEYSVINKAMAASNADNRFMLSASVDGRTKKMLADSLAKLRSTVRIPSVSPNAAPARSIPAQRNIKYLWAKRTSIGLAFALLLGILWFNFNGKNEQITQVPVNTPSVMPAEPAPAPVPKIQTPSNAEMATINQPEKSVTTRASILPTKKVNISKNSSLNELAANTMSQTEAPHAPQEKQQIDPADVMISHRYAKMIKATPVVEVTQQDRM